jgi:hypothetical protein
MLGDVRFNNFKVADNPKSGIEITKAGTHWADDLTQINGALVIGKSANGRGSATKKGIVTA